MWMLFTKEVKYVKHKVEQQRKLKSRANIWDKTSNLVILIVCYIDCPKEGLETVKSNVLDVDESTKSENLLPCALKEIYDGK